MLGVELLRVQGSGFRVQGAVFSPIFVDFGYLLVSGVGWVSGWGVYLRIATSSLADLRSADWSKSVTAFPFLPARPVVERGGFSVWHSLWARAREREIEK